VKGLFVSLFLCLFLQKISFSQQNVILNNIPIIDSTSGLKGKNIYKALLDSNFLLNTKAAPVAFKIEAKKQSNSEFFFYLILFLFLILGITRTVFTRYFDTLFRVFFNTSLRQNQLTDQLEQAKLPSLIFNIFFIITSGMYIYFVINFFSNKPYPNNLLLMLSCIAAIGFSYFVKYISLKLTGWVSQHEAEAKTYIFIVFLLNKVIGIFLLPVLAIMAFSSKSFVLYTVIGSFIVLSILLIMRFFRSFSLLQQRLKVSRFHFFMYIVGVEILPLLVIYKTVMIYLGKNT
jgi:hypothetical protein